MGTAGPNAQRGVAVGLVLSGLWALGPMATAGDAPEISRSAGDARTVVVLWPRVAPRSSSPITRAAAHVVQQQLVNQARQAFPGFAIDVRPEPERVCPRAGWVGPSVGAVLIHHQQGCAVAALVAPGGPSPQALVPWAGSLVVRTPSVPFREPAESHLTVMDFARCDRLAEPLQAGAPAVQQALAQVQGVRAAAPTHAPVVRVNEAPSPSAQPIRIPVPPAEPAPPASDPVPSGWEE